MDSKQYIKLIGIHNSLQLARKQLWRMQNLDIYKANEAIINAITEIDRIKDTYKINSQS